MSGCCRTNSDNNKKEHNSKKKRESNHVRVMMMPHPQRERRKNYCDSHFHFSWNTGHDFSHTSWINTNSIFLPLPPLSFPLLFFYFFFTLFIEHNRLSLAFAPLHFPSSPIPIIHIQIPKRSYRTWFVHHSDATQPNTKLTNFKTIYKNT